jgi:1-acyl-sn-glycerol-3-phosphate acyltransferase
MTTAFGVVAIVAMNAVCYPLLIALTLLSLIFVWPLIFLTGLLTGWSKGKSTRFFVWVYGRLWLWLFSPFVSFRREGFTPELGETPSVLVLNHQSFFDTYFMGGLPIFNIAFAVRSWPFKMFWFSPFMRMAEYLDVESLDHHDSQARAIELLKGGTHVLFYPEGHRSRDGKLGRFYSGAFRLAKDAGVPVVPLCVSGSGKLLAPGRWWFKPARVTVKALTPVDPAAFEGELGHRGLMNHVRQAIASELGQVEE